MKNITSKLVVGALFCTILVMTLAQLVSADQFKPLMRTFPRGPIYQGLSLSVSTGSAPAKAGDAINVDLNICNSTSNARYVRGVQHGTSYEVRATAATNRRAVNLGYVGGFGGSESLWGIKLAPSTCFSLRKPLLIRKTTPPGSYDVTIDAIGLRDSSNNARVVLSSNPFTIEVLP